MGDQLTIIGLIVTTVFGIISAVLAKRQLVEAKKQSELTLKNINEELEESQTALKSKEKELKLVKGTIPDDIEIISNVHDALLRLNKIIEERAQENKRVEVQIFGLDLQSIIPWFMTKFIHDDFYSDIHLTFRLMLVDPDIPSIKPLIDSHSNISKDAIIN